MTRKYRGISSVGNRWRAQAQVDGKMTHIGYYDTEEDAYYARLMYMKNIGRHSTIINLEGEEWRQSPLLGHPIWVSNKGRIKTVDFDRMGFESLLKFGKGWNDRYNTVMVKQKTYMVHRLVADAFLGQSKFEVNHIDNNSRNNCVENLEYVTHRENISHGFNGATGITYIKTTGRWRAAIKVNGERTVLGTFEDMDTAHQKYLDAIEKMGEHNKYAISPKEKHS